MFKRELEKWKKESGATYPILYKLRYLPKELSIFTAQPGWLIGKGGVLIDKYTAILKEILGDELVINMVETEYDVI